MTTSDWNALGSTEKTIIVVVLAVLIFCGLWVKQSFDLDKSYLEKGFKPCSFLVPGRGDVIRTWQQDCSLNPKVIE